MESPADKWTLNQSRAANGGLLKGLCFSHSFLYSIIIIYERVFMFKKSLYVSDLDGTLLRGIIKERGYL